MTDFTQNIDEIEEEIRKTPYHKGTEHHIGILRARLARLKDKALEFQTKKSGGGGGYGIKKHGDATVVLVGPPSVGKSTLINRLTNAESKVAAYEFTTVSVIPGMLKYKDAYIQILDLPGLIGGAGRGRGKGRQVLSVIRNADLIIIMCDVKTLNRLDQIRSELSEAGIRINQKRPEVVIEKKTSGPINIRSNIRQDISFETVKNIALEMGIKSADITLKEKLSLEGLIDAFSISRVYIPAIEVINKSDLLDPKDAQLAGAFYLSAEEGLGIDELKEKIWEKLGLLRVYLVQPQEEPSFKNPIIAKRGDTLETVAQKIGLDFAEEKKLAKIWGPNSRFPGQEVSLETEVREGMQIRFV